MSSEINPDKDKKSFEMTENSTKYKRAKNHKYSPWNPHDNTSNVGNHKGGNGQRDIIFKPINVIAKVILYSSLEYVSGY